MTLRSTGQLLSTEQPQYVMRRGLDLRVSTTIGMSATRYGRGLSSGTTSSAKYAHADVLGSVRLLTDGTGTEVGTALYDAFGAVRAQTGVQLPLGYTGEQRDAESGLIYLRARSYDPKMGRFLSTDPVRGSATRPASQHAYVYALNNPLRYRDPRGREAGDAACCDAAYGDAVAVSAPAHEPLVASHEPITGGPDDPNDLPLDQFLKYLSLLGLCRQVGGDACNHPAVSAWAVGCAKDPICAPGLMEVGIIVTGLISLPIPNCVGRSVAGGVAAGGATFAGAKAVGATPLLTAVGVATTFVGTTASNLITSC
jgi:RHS repeat-associated protein